MPGSYNGITIKPIQSVSISEQPSYSESGKLQKYLFNIIVVAKFVVSQSNHAAIVSFVSSLSVLMSKLNQEFSISGPNNAPPIKFMPRVKSVNIKEDIWVDFCDYTIEMEADDISIGGQKFPAGLLISSEVDNSWSIDYDESDPRFYKISHKLSVKSKTSFTTGVEIKGYVIAKQKLETLIGQVIPQSIVSASKETFVNPHNKKTSKTLDITNGVATADIVIVYHDNSAFSGFLPQANLAYHDQTVSETVAGDSLRERLSIEGTITGLSGISSKDRYSNASALWNTVRTDLDTLYINLIISSFSLSEDKIKGIISYSYEIENKQRPAGSIKSETININIQASLAAPPKVVVIHNTIVGGSGPIFQDIETKKARSMTITIERVGTEINPDTMQYRPQDSEIESDVITFVAAQKKISRTTTFIWSKITPFIPPVISDHNILNTKIPRPYE